MPDLLLSLAHDYREDARQARELAACLSVEVDRRRLLRLAEEQEAHAAELDAKAKVYAPDAPSGG